MLSLALNMIDIVNKIKLRETALPVLYFHRVLAADCAFCPDDWQANNFELLIEKLTKHFSLISLEEALYRLQNKILPRNALCLTFDDGYADNYEIAAPIIESVGGKASFFIATQGTEKGYLWNDELMDALKKTTEDELNYDSMSFELSSNKKKADAYLALVGKLKVLSNLERDRELQWLKQCLGEFKTERCMMTPKQLIDLQNRGHSIGAHTHTHSILAYQSHAVANSEITASIDILNALLPKKINCFAYPNGWLGRDFTKAHEDMIKQHGIEYGFATNDGGVTSKSEKTRLPRFMPHRKELNQFCIAVKKIAGEKLSD